MKNVPLTEQFQAARRAGTPLLAVRTPDPFATVSSLAATMGKSPRFAWDVVTGLSALNEPAKEALLSGAFKNGGFDPVATVDASIMLGWALKLPDLSAVFMLNAHRYVNDATIAQAIWNLREPFKASERTLVMLGPSMRLPMELEHDVIILTEPLPNSTTLEAITRDVYAGAGIKKIDPQELVKAVDAVRGLAAFPAEQVAAMSITEKGMDIDALWERKRVTIEQTPGLSVNRGAFAKSQVGGNRAIIQFAEDMFAGHEPPRVVVFIDEAEKMFAGTDGDNTGVAQAFHGGFLKDMEDHGYDGLLFVGPPGAAKSLVAKTIGNIGGVPTISFDLAGMKTSALGESEERFRRALEVVRAVGDGRALFILTCNKHASLSPELKRRLTYGTYYFDLPTENEKIDIWNIYRTQYGLKNDPAPDDTDWTGAEIRNCARIAYRLKRTLKQAAESIVPVARIDPQGLASLRQQAHGVFLSAATGGVYKIPNDEPAAPKGRKIGGAAA